MQIEYKLNLQFERTWDEMVPDEKEELHQRAADSLQANNHLLMGALREIEFRAAVQDLLLLILPQIDR